MRYAINCNGQLVDAHDEIHGNFFCSECGDLCHLRIGNERIPHFYHAQHNPDCVMSSQQNHKFWNSDDCIKYLTSENYIKRWFYSIMFLYEAKELNRIWGRPQCLPALKLFCENMIADKNARRIIRDNLILHKNDYDTKHHQMIDEIITIFKRKKRDGLKVIVIKNRLQ